MPAKLQQNPSIKEKKKIINKYTERISLRPQFTSIFIIMACLAVFWAYEVVIKEIQGREDVQVVSQQQQGIDLEIPKGATEREIAQLLKENGVIRYPSIYRVVSRVKGYSSLYKAGVHNLQKGMGYNEIFDELSSNTVKVINRRFTIPEGYTIRQIADKLAAEGFISKDKFFDIIKNERFSYKFLEGIDEKMKADLRDFRLEGYLFPDTYEVGPQETEKDIIKKMLDRFNEIFKPEYYEKADKLKMTTDQVVILASLIEREAKTEQDRKLVSAVFNNRLASKDLQRLESCATIQYVLGFNKEVLSIEDTRIPSPYNTYINPGLPPGPISNPGKASLEAALEPDKVSYLYFVAKSDGTHIFSNTYEEHLEATRKAEASR